MTDIKAKTIADSIGEHSPRLWTVETRTPQMVHQEVLRHRRIITEEGLSVLGLGWEPDFSYSVSSTRAVPFFKLVQEVMDPELRAAPVHWGSAQKGMVPGEELDDTDYCIWWPDAVFRAGISGFYVQEFVTKRECAKRLWEAGALFVARAADAMVHFCDPHKSIPNRMITPYTHYNVLMTGTEPGWLNFFGLRLDGAADPIVRALAEKLWVEWNESTPKKLQPGQWHLPYADDAESEVERAKYLPYPSSIGEKEAALQLKIKMSVARCAHLSYTSFETGERMTVDQCFRLYDRLVGSVPIHASPAEHQATPDDRHSHLISSATGEGDWMHLHQAGNLGPGWVQYRKILPNESIAPLPEAYR